MILGLQYRQIISNGILNRCQLGDRGAIRAGTWALAEADDTEDAQTWQLLVTGFRKTRWTALESWWLDREFGYCMHVTGIQHDAQ